MGRRAGEERSAVLSASCVEICSGSKMNGMSLCMRAVSGWARWAKFLMNTQTTPTILRNVQTSERSVQGPQLTILSTLTGSRMRPSEVQTWPTTVILWAHTSNFLLENIPPLYFIHCTIQLTFWKCSQMKWRILLFSGIVLKALSSSW